MIGITIAFISLLTVLFIIYPLLKREASIAEKEGGEDQSGDSVLKKESVYASLKELEFDYQTGKLSRQDYQELRSGLESMALSLLKEADRPKEEKDRHKTIEEEIELEVLRVREEKGLSSAKKRRKDEQETKEGTPGDLNNDQKE